MDYHLLPAMVFCSLGVILVCLAIRQVRRERTEILKRMTRIEELLEELND